jgi:hypothetical protein
MAKTITQEERQLVKLVESLPIAEGEKTALAERIRNGEMSEDLANEIHQKVAGMEEPADDERGQVNRQRFLTELSMLVRRWRLSNQSKNFGKR